MEAVISQRELRNDSGAIMRRVEQGESFVVTRNGVAVADLVPHRADMGTRRRAVPVADVASGLGELPSWGAARFREELAELDSAVEDPTSDPWLPRE
jgi:prevent-host-death family protein